MTSTLEFTTITSDGAAHRVAELGTGPAVVLIHGFPDTPMSWEHTARQVADLGFRAVVPYLRGYHPDTIIEGRGYGRAETGADVIGLLDALDIERATLVGHDFGASLVWNALGLAPERVDGVVPIAIPHPSTLKPSPGFIWMARHFINFKVPGALGRMQRNDFAYLDRLYERWSPSWSGAEQAAAVARAKEAFGDERVAREVVERYKDVRPEKSSAATGSIPTRALLVAGSDDFGGDLAPYRRSVELFAEPSSLFVAEGAGHWPHRERSDEFDQALAEFLAAT
ncbi:alpha/beta fold hydrolase [Ilumatobacter coccineus]|uniref:Putative hydrolase n=1 Tax=Ilumatobacter coccineus (strain NBRC 103263 / KCTC 29153 / YM16-304) TaxID=1313172 RepID=A0A6C7ED47_ILUCY|nr:alpha/beta hydrolase [Ilumatobacter coccineus]BAN03922.1 putative hydrolase [Ilumatobacter coccineus YM16-304]